MPDYTTLTPKTGSTSDAAYQSYRTWLKETYGEDQLMKADSASLNAWTSPVYAYWVKWFWKPTHGFTYDQDANDYVWKGRADTPVPPAPDVDTPSDEATYPYGTGIGFKNPLPSNVKLNGQSIPVNYTVIGTRTVKGQTHIALDPATGGLASFQDTPDQLIYLYAAVPSLENVNSSTVKDIMNNVYAVTDAGDIYNDGKPLASTDLQGLFNYDPAKGEYDLTDLSQTVSEAAMTKWVKDSGYPTITADMQKYIKSQASLWANGQYTGLDTLKQDLENNFGTGGESLPSGTSSAMGGAETASNVSLSDNQIENLISRFKYSPAVAAETRRARRQLTDAEIQSVDSGEGAARQANMNAAPARENYQNEQKLLQDTVNHYQADYEKYKDLAAEVEKTKVLPQDAGSQYGIAAVNKYNIAQKRLAEITQAEKSGDYTKSDLYLTGPGDQTRIKQTATELGIQPGELMKSSVEYLSNPFDAKYNNLSISDKQKLAYTGMDLGYGENQVTAPRQKTPQELEAERLNQWNSLLEKARLKTALPQRMVTI